MSLRAACRRALAVRLAAVKREEEAARHSYTTIGDHAQASRLLAVGGRSRRLREAAQRPTAFLDYAERAIRLARCGIDIEAIASAFVLGEPAEQLAIDESACAATDAAHASL